jgi:hypothetical protein
LGERWWRRKRRFDPWFGDSFEETGKTERIACTEGGKGNRGNDGVRVAPMGPPSFYQNLLWKSRKGVFLNGVRI